MIAYCVLSCPEPRSARLHPESHPPPVFRTFFQVTYSLSSFPAHSYENCRGVPRFFPNRHPLTPLVPSPRGAESRPLFLLSIPCESPHIGHTFGDPLFSITSNSQILQALCFDNDTNCRCLPLIQRSSAGIPHPVVHSNLSQMLKVLS